MVTDVLIVSTPIRPKPTAFPPIGSLALLKYLRRNGIESADFYNIDGNRPSFDQALAHIVAQRPKVLGISAVVSTAYGYTKRLALAIRQALPDTLIVVGGNLAAMSEVLLRRAGVDLCALGEGEKVFLTVVRRFLETGDRKNFADIAGLMLLDGAGKLVNTGYPGTLIGAEVHDFDLEDLTRTSDISHYIHPAFDDGVPRESWYVEDPRAAEPQRADKRIAYLAVGKGCVARCTFCHRWDKGIRHIPVDLVLSRLDELVRRYNVGFVKIYVESFATDKRWLAEFLQKLKPYDILWTASGIRANSVTEELIHQMRDAGCCSLTYGAETGSERILQVMEKKVALEDNYNSLRWTHLAGLCSPVQLVLGMPGETPETIRETIEFCKASTSVTPEQDPNGMSINYAQALPGTALYEFARHRGLIGRGVDDEEEYLLSISDRDAHDEHSTLNFTDYPRLVCRTWRPLINIEVNYHYVRKYGLAHYYRHLLSSPDLASHRQESGYFANPLRLLEQGASENLSRPRLPSLLARGRFGLAMLWYPVLFHRIRALLPLLILVKEVRERGMGSAWGLVREALSFYGRRLVKRGGKPFEYKSLRKIVDGELGPLPQDAPEMQPLRRGR